MSMTVGSLFSGIGGLELGLEWAGMRVIWQAEIDPFCRKVLEKHWPNVRRYEDVRDVRGGSVETPDIICGGFPCQPVSYAGKREGEADPRWLWPEFARVVDEVRPRFVLVENVPGLYTSGLSGILRDLSAFGYDAEWDSIPAAAVGAPHLRYRVFIVAYSDKLHGNDRRLQSSQILGQRSSATELCRSKSGSVADTEGEQCNGGDHHRRSESRSLPEPRNGGQETRPDGGWWSVEPDVGRVAHGVPARVDRLRALGNAVVPQVAEWVGKRIIAFEAARG